MTMQAPPFVIGAPHPVHAVAQWYQELSPHSLGRLSALYAAEARFKDPFNDVKGLAAIEQIFRHMYASTERPHFVMLQAFGAGDQGFVRWEFYFHAKRRDWRIEGCTYFTFDAQGKVSLHRDYWDVAEEFWQKIPLIGGLVRWLRRRFQTPPA
ncbi:nuclear transport factor 2 family protein [Massilia sp. W12]|uniref:nuclear transport factor 2 family protein n=1 Tax=Massilia sp. W12 TaxID=3126507 RepID=UPI0030D3790D